MLALTHAAVFLLIVGTPFVFAFGIARVLALVFLRRHPKGLLARTVPRGGLAYLATSLAIDALLGNRANSLEGAVSLFGCLVTVALAMRRYQDRAGVAAVFD